jgi:K+/H+ antiporter YhaU regulatory subunit KhtT
MVTGRADDAPGPTELPHVEEIRLEGGAFADQSLREARIRERFGVTVVAVTRPDGVVFNPAPETLLREGDVLRVFGLGAQIAAFAERAREQRTRRHGDGDWMHS